MTILIIEVLFLNKLWEKFLKTGKVEDYLKYRDFLDRTNGKNCKKTWGSIKDK